MGSTHYLEAFDRDMVDDLLSLTWHEYLDRSDGFGDQWESPEQALTDFFLDPHPDDDHLARRIVGSWTLRRTMRHCNPKIFFLEQLFCSYPSGTCGYVVSDDANVYEDGCDVIEEMQEYKCAVIPAFFERQLTDAAFRAAMKLIDASVGTDCEMTRRQRGVVARVLKGNVPKVVFSGIPPFGDKDRETALSTRETTVLLQMNEKGWNEGWLRHCVLAAKLRQLSRETREVLVWYRE